MLLSELRMKNIQNLIISVILLIFGIVKTPNNPIIMYIFTGFVIVSVAGFLERQFPRIQQTVILLVFAFALGYLLPIVGFQNLIASLLVVGFFICFMCGAFGNIVLTLSEKGFLRKNIASEPEREIAQYKPHS